MGRAVLQGTQRLSSPCPASSGAPHLHPAGHKGLTPAKMLLGSFPKSSGEFGLACMLPTGNHWRATSTQVMRAVPHCQHPG